MLETRRVEVRPTLQKVRRECNRHKSLEQAITSKQVAEEARVTLMQEYLVEIGAIVPEDIATKVLAAFSRLTTTLYTPQDIAITIRKENYDLPPVERRSQNRRKFPQALVGAF